MIKNIKDTLHKYCLLGLSYYDAEGNFIKQNILAGQVIAVDKKQGITLTLQKNTRSSPNANFIIPANLSCWFTCPQGEYHTSQENGKIINPDYLVTWDIYQTVKKPSEASESTDGEQQWWQWHPRIQKPEIG
jgi:hypothetical protein